MKPWIKRIADGRHPYVRYGVANSEGLHQQSYNIILDSRRRVTPVGAVWWDEVNKQWGIVGMLWNRRTKTWSQPQLLHCREFECEMNTMSSL